MLTAGGNKTETMIYEKVLKPQNQGINHINILNSKIRNLMIVMTGKNRNAKKGEGTSL